MESTAGVRPKAIFSSFMYDGLEPVLILVEMSSVQPTKATKAIPLQAIELDPCL